MMMINKILRTAVAFGLCCVLSTACHGQGTGGTISGTVTDPKHLSIDAATVTVTNLGKGEVRTATTNNSGLYSVPNLQPGQYLIAVTATGFRTDESKDILIQVGDQLVQDYELTVGGVSEKVDVQSQTATVELGSATLSNVVNGKTVRDLPLNGRDWTLLAALEPGVHTVDAQQASGTSTRATRGFGTQVTIGGNRASQNVYRLDGVIVNDYSGGGPSGVSGNALGVDAVQEFSVVTGAPSADYGRTSGGVINGITRSGQNQYHGSLYEFIRNNALDARNYFDTASLPFKRNQFGGTIGGPLSVPGLYNAQNKTFFFFNYEGLRQSLTSTVKVTVPSRNARTGILTTGTVAVRPEIIPYLALYALPDSGTESGNVGTSSFSSKLVTTDNFYTGRIDHTFSSADSFHTTFLTTNSVATGPDGTNFTNQQNKSSRTTASVEETHIFNANLVNVARIGYNRSIVNSQIPAGAIDARAADSSLGFLPGANVGTLTITSLTTISGGIGGIAETDYLYNSYQATEDLIWQHGRHSIKIGGAGEYTQLTEATQNAPSGVFIFGSVLNFITNKPTTFSASIPGNSPRIYLRQAVPGVYVQDDYRVKKNLTLNFGARYELATVPSEKYNHLSNLANVTDATPRVGGPYYDNATFKNISPRVGFAWDPFSAGKTSVRGGFGLYDALPLTYDVILLAVNAAPFFQSGSISPAPALSFPKTAFTLLSPNTLRYSYIDSHPKRSYIEQWNLSVQQELPARIVLLVGYAGQHGVHQPFRCNDANIVLPTQTAQGLIWPNPRGSGTKINPSVGTINYLNWTGSNSYEALNLGVQRQAAGLRIGGAYTWSESLDLSSTAIGGDFYNSLVGSFPYYPKVFRGLSDFDVRNNLVLNALWQLPQPKALKGSLGLAARGWQVSGIAKFANGLPFTPVIGGDPLGLNNSQAFGFPDRANNPSCATPINPRNVANYIRTECFVAPKVNTPLTPQRLGNSGRNSAIGPGVRNFDVSLLKDTHFGERFRAEFRAEFFNVFNHANFGVPDRTAAQLYDVNQNPVAGAGSLKTTATTSRQIQFGLKLSY